MLSNSSSSLTTSKGRFDLDFELRFEGPADADGSFRRFVEEVAIDSERDLVLAVDATERDVRLEEIEPRVLFFATQKLKYQ